MRVLLDVNVLLDSLLQRTPWNKEADDILSAAATGQLTCSVTTLSLATLFYVGRKAVGTQAARAGVRRHLAAFNILAIDKQTLLEDAIVTRNVADFAHSTVTVWEPAELLKRLGGAGPPPASAVP